MSQQFIDHLRTEINANARNWHTNNWPLGDKGPEPDIELYPEFRRIASKIRRNAFAAALPELYHGRLRLLAREGVLFLFPALIYKRRVNTYADIAYLYDLLANDESRALLVKLLAFRIMGHKRVRLPRNTPVHDEYIEKIGHLPVVGPALSVNFMNITLELRDLSSIDFNLRAYCTSGGGSYVFLQRQYEYHCGDVHCKAEAGDMVVDAGACWGETSLYFAHEVGPFGRVFSFEFIPSNLEVLAKNISKNPALSDRIIVVEKPLWSESDRTLYYVDWGPWSRVSFAKLREDFADTQCQTTTIDEIASKRNLPRLDMIKMDIEGAELNALKGAERCIRQYHPKLAISLYHNIEDFSTIPRYLDSLDVPYKYYLDHHTIYENETVLFAVPQQRPNALGRTDIASRVPHEDCGMRRAGALQFEGTKDTPLGMPTADAVAMFKQLGYQDEDYFEHFACFIGAKTLGRFLSLYECYKRTLGIAGHIAEVGVFRGATSMFLAKLTLLYEPHSFTQVHGFDWFKPPTADEIQSAYAQMYYEPYERIERVVEVQGLKRYVLLHQLNVVTELEGFFRDHSHLRFKLVFLDAGEYQIVARALREFWPRLTNGGIIIFDQFNHEVAPGETQAISELLPPDAVLRAFPNGWMPTAYVVKGETADHPSATTTNWSMENSRKRDGI